MSHAMGKVLFPNNKVFYYEYDGTSDFVIVNLYETEDEVRANWRNHPQRRCICQNPVHELVEISTNYGGGNTWQGRACQTCMVITEGLSPYDSPENEEVMEVAREFIAANRGLLRKLAK